MVGFQFPIWVSSLHTDKPILQVLTEPEMEVDAYLKKVREVCAGYKNNQHEVNLSLVQLFDIDIHGTGGRQMAILQNCLLDNNVNIDERVDNLNLFDSDWNAFGELVKSYLRLCRDVIPTDLKYSYAFFALYYVDLQIAFSNTRGAVLESTIVNSSKVVVRICIACYKQDKETCSEWAPHLASVLFKIFHSIRGERISATSKIHSKKGAMLYVASTLCRLYFLTSQVSSCANVFSNIHTAKINWKSYPRSQRVEYRYFLGRFYLQKNRLKIAYKHLSWAFDSCLSSSPNKRLILKYLLVCSILLGRLPTDAVLKSYNLWDEYGELVRSFKQGNLASFYQALEERKLIFLKRGVYLTLKQRSVVPMLRNLFKRSLSILDTAPGSKKLSYDQLAAACRFGGLPFMEKQAEDIDLLMENICVTLIDEGLMKAHVYYRSRAIVLKANGAFPPISVVHNIDGPLDGLDAWMEGN